MAANNDNNNNNDHLGVQAEIAFAGMGNPQVLPRPKKLNAGDVEAIVFDIRNYRPGQWAKYLWSKNKYKPVNAARGADLAAQPSPQAYWGSRGVLQAQLADHRNDEGHGNCQLGAHANEQDSRSLFHDHVGGCKLLSHAAFVNPEDPMNRNGTMLTSADGKTTHFENIYERKIWTAIMRVEPSIMQYPSICSACVSAGNPLCLLDSSREGTGSCLRCSAKKAKCDHTHVSAKNKVLAEVNALQGAAAASGAGPSWAQDRADSALQGLRRLR